MAQNKFDFYEVVVVKDTNDQRNAEIVGARGCVLGMAQCEESELWYYSVSIEGICWSVAEEKLSKTGEFRSRSDFYSGESIRVRVDPATGEGSVVD